MPNFPSEFSSKVAKYIRKLDSQSKVRVEEGIEKLELNPFPPDIERVKKYKNERAFRTRIGDLRILYLVRHNPNKLIILLIDKRSRVYK